MYVFETGTRPVGFGGWHSRARCDVLGRAAQAAFFCLRLAFPLYGGQLPFLLQGIRLLEIDQALEGYGPRRSLGGCPGAYPPTCRWFSLSKLCMLSAPVRSGRAKPSDGL